MTTEHTQSTRPSAQEKREARLELTWPPSLKRLARETARRRGESLSQYVSSAVTKALLAEGVSVPK
jgi:hypothetical protein